MITMHLALLLLSTLATSAFADKVIMTNNGPLQGITVHSGEVEVEGFLGIPYAEPPLGRLRFRNPVPKTSWMGVYDASTIPPPCIQSVTLNHYYEPNTDNMTEDCLFLNLWVPYSKNTEPKTIMIFIHGGAFNLGASNQEVYNGANLAKFGDVIVGSMNYRVGAMGWFSAFIDGANGNMGGFDTILAAKWIKDNARSFGGDPDNIVLFGESAGGMISSGHLVSPLSRNIFRRIIMQSGAAVSTLILDDNQALLKRSHELAKLAGCADKNFTLKDNPSLVVKCLRHLPAEALAVAEGKMKALNPVTFIPRVGDSFLPKPTIHLLKEGHFQDGGMINGISKFEGPFFLTVTAPQYFGTYGVNNVQSISKRFAHQMMQVVYKNTEQKNQKEIADFYINGIQNGTSDMYTMALAQSMGDYLISCGCVFYADIYAVRNPVYFYVFNKRPPVTPLAEWMEVTHFDEIPYVFGNPLFSDNFTQEEEVFSRRLMSRWVQFAKTGDPNLPGELTWPLFTHENPQYLEINDEESVWLRPTNSRCEFWRDRFQATYDPAVVSKVRRSLGTSVSLSSANCNAISLLSSFLLLVVHIIRKAT